MPITTTPNLLPAIGNECFVPTSTIPAPMSNKGVGISVQNTGVSIAVRDSGKEVRLVQLIDEVPRVCSYKRVRYSAEGTTGILSGVTTSDRSRNVNAGFPCYGVISNPLFNPDGGHPLGHPDYGTGIGGDMPVVMMEGLNDTNTFHGRLWYSIEHDIDNTTLMKFYKKCPTSTEVPNYEGAVPPDVHLVWSFDPADQVAVGTGVDGPGEGNYYDPEITQVNNSGLSGLVEIGNDGVNNIDPHPLRYVDWAQCYVNKIDCRDASVVSIQVFMENVGGLPEPVVEMSIAPVVYDPSGMLMVGKLPSVPVVIDSETWIEVPTAADPDWSLGTTTSWWMTETITLPTHGAAYLGLYITSLSATVMDGTVNVLDGSSPGVVSRGLVLYAGAL